MPTSVNLTFGPFFIKFEFLVFFVVDFFVQASLQQLFYRTTVPLREFYSVDRCGMFGRS